MKWAVALIVLVLVTAAACSGDDDASPPAAWPTPNPAGIPPLYPGWHDDEVGMWAHRADVVVIGQVVDVSDARWTTPDGNVPAGFNGGNLYRTGYTIYSTATVNVDRVLAGDDVPELIPVTSWAGERDGVSSFNIDIGPVFAVGQEVVVFLYEPGREFWAPRENWESVQEFQVIDGQAGHEGFPHMSLDALLADIETALAVPEDEWDRDWGHRFPSFNLTTEAAIRADTIVRGVVIDVGNDRWSTPDGKAPVGYDPFDWQSDSNQFIYQAASVEVTDVIAGRDVPERITVSSYGGTVDGQSWPPDDDSVWSLGGPVFKPGEEVVLFLLEARTPRIVPSEYWMAILDYHVTDGMGTNRYDEPPIAVQDIIAAAVEARESAVPPVE